MIDPREAQGCVGKLTFGYKGTTHTVHMLIGEIETRHEGPYRIYDGPPYARAIGRTRITVIGTIVEPPAKKRFTPAAMEAD